MIKRSFSVRQHTFQVIRQQISIKTSHNFQIYIKLTRGKLPSIYQTVTLYSVDEFIYENHLKIHGLSRRLEKD